MIIDCVSDLHGHFPELSGGDLLIVAGDVQRNLLHASYLNFCDWFSEQKYKKKVFIAGNHDMSLAVLDRAITSIEGCDYLQDSNTEFEGLKIWGSPWVRGFGNWNVHAKAFCVENDKELSRKWEMIPDDTDILITHSPPIGILDMDLHYEQCGSPSLAKKIEKIAPKLHVFGHIHESYGIFESSTTKFVNAALMNENYKPLNKPLRIVL
jgi:Icc-related predicted phosphoesterase